MSILTAVIPDKVSFHRESGDESLNRKAICIFAATGFFLETDSYFNNLTALQPARGYEFDATGRIISSKPYWEWHYSPKDISLKQATEEFAQLFEQIVSEEVKGNNVILPLSGGLDSRTQAAAMPAGTKVSSYSYAFADSFDETRYGRAIAKARNFPFHSFEIPEGYLWDRIVTLASLNECYSEFTHPRQMAVTEKIAPLGNLFNLGHWGDVLFDDMGVPGNLSFDEQVTVVLKKIVKKGGAELGSALWAAWGLDGNFNDYLRSRIIGLLSAIKIDDANARIRAFKSLYWAPRWTSVNLSVFSSLHPIALPYYDSRMCEFICNIPEAHLAGRQIQIEYLKMKTPELAKIPWQVYDPYNLYNYKDFGSAGNLPRRVVKKGIRVLREKILKRPPLTTRNWEIQFLGEKNDLQLRNYLFNNKEFGELIPAELTETFYNKFRNDNPVWYSHPVSMLLTLSLFAQKNKRQ